MGLDHFARPFRVEQVGKALGSFLRTHKSRVVAERGKPDACRSMKSVRVAVGWRKMPRNILGKIRRQPTLAFPDHKVRGVRAVYHIDHEYAAAAFLLDALIHPLR